MPDTNKTRFPLYNQTSRTLHGLLVFIILSIVFSPVLLFASSITGFTLIDADLDTEISAITNGATINLASLPTTSLNVRVDTSPETVDNVSISLGGATVVSKTESTPPYALWGDQSGNYNSGSFNLGQHTLSATPTQGGLTGTPLAISFNVIDTMVTTPTVTCDKDKYLFPPATEVYLHCTANDIDGTITSYQLSQVEGPTTPTLSSTSTSSTTVSNLSEGIYTLRLTVTDNDNNTGFDDIDIHVFGSSGDPDAVSPTGELRKWHKLTFTFDGPATSETAATNPFTDYRLDVTFINGDTSYTVPGYFAADGNAGNTGAGQGDKWRVHLAPDNTGLWYYVVSFRTGTDIIDSDDPDAGIAVTPLDGMIGNFTVAETNKTGRDFRGKGMLKYIGGRYLRFAGNNEYFLKQGADAPENFLAYDDFDNTPDYGGRRKSWSAHVSDWASGDPTWMGSKGKGIIGALNYLASEEMNAFSFIPMNIGGDDQNVFPYISDDQADRTRLDCSKLDQWEVVFEHADKLGLFLHFKTQETENELLLDGGNLGIERKVYYRELIARYSHHLALNWNLGEEINDASTAQKKSWAQYFYDHDPYHHHIVIHNGSSHHDLLGSDSKLTGFSLQTNFTDFRAVHSQVKDYINRSVAAGKPWAVACDEPGDASHALRPDYDAGNSHEDGRKNGIWGTFMAGGWGNEWYFGYAHDHSDMTCEDFRSRDNWWDYCRYGLQFFKNNSVLFWQMSNNNSISSAADGYCLFKPGSQYVIYLKNGGTTSLDLRSYPGTYSVRWYDPRHGGNLKTGSKTQISGGTWADLGYPPNSTGDDWTILVSRTPTPHQGTAVIAPLMMLMK